jgi:cobalt transporter subunit CbtA
MLVSGLLAGFAVALLATLLQFAFLESHILLAERYESGELSYFHAAHDQVAADATAQAVETAHVHPAADDEPFWQRQAKTVLAMLITYGGYGLVLVAGFAFANHFGLEISLETGLLWGVAGFACFALAPAMGLEPELPGVESAGLEARQVWWLGCAIATAAGLVTLCYGRGFLLRLSGVVWLVLPHWVGAPHLGSFTGIIPPELAASFAARSLGVGLVAWVSLGGLAAWLWNRPA